jgi:hypothetical protein
LCCFCAVKCLNELDTSWSGYSAVLNERISE